MFFLYLLATVQILIFAPPKDLRHRIQEHPGDISDDYVQMLVMLSDHFFRMYIYVYIYNIIYIIYIHTYIHPQTLPDFNEAHELRPRGRCLCRVGQVCPAARGNRSGGQR